MQAVADPGVLAALSLALHVEDRGGDLPDLDRDEMRPHAPLREALDLARDRLPKRPAHRLSVDDLRWHLCLALAVGRSVSRWARGA